MILIAGWFLGWLSNKNMWISYNPETKYGIWEILYYIAAIITAFGTVEAVFVALFKERIFRLFSHPSLALSMKDDRCFSEDVDSEQQNPTSSQYLGILSVENTGNIVATGCEVYIEKVQYAKSRDKRLKDITDAESKRKLTWEAPRVDVPVSIPKQVLLFKIDKPNAYGTPFSSNSQQGVQCHLQLNGMKLRDNMSEKGVWEITYYINNVETGHKRFKLTIDWNGEWKTRKTEMIDVLKVKFDTILEHILSNTSRVRIRPSLMIG